jgi:phage terminase small subunit
MAKAGPGRGYFNPNKERMGTARTSKKTPTIAPPKEKQATQPVKPQRIAADEAKSSKWDEVVSRLEKSNLLNEMHSDLVALYVDSFVDAEREPDFKQRVRLMMLALGFMKELVMTPHSGLRMGLKPTSENADDDFDDTKKPKGGQ